MVTAAAIPTTQFVSMLVVAVLVAESIPLVFGLDSLYRQRNHLSDRRSLHTRKLLRLVMIECGAVGCELALLSLLAYGVLPRWQGAFSVAVVVAALVAACALVLLLHHIYPWLFPWMFSFLPGR